MSDHVPGTMHRDQHGNVIEDFHMCGCHAPERSAGASPIEPSINVGRIVARLAALWHAGGEGDDCDQSDGLWCEACLADASTIAKQDDPMTLYCEADAEYARSLLDATPVGGRCDRIVNNGMGEPTECGRMLPCEAHERSAGASPIDAEEWDRLGGYPPPPAPGEDLIVSGDPIILFEGTDR